MFLLRYFKHIPSQYQNDVYIFIKYYSSLNNLFILFMFSNNRIVKEKNLKHSKQINTLQNILFLQLQKLDLCIKI